MDFEALSKLFLFLSAVGGFVLFAHPKTRVSRILSHAFGPIPREGELRSDFLLRVSGYSAVWLIVLLALCSLIYILVTDFGVKFQKEEANLFILLAIACLVAMAFLGMVGSFVWSALVRIFDRDGVYLVTESETPGDG